jgi:hypothetical protein
MRNLIPGECQPEAGQKGEFLRFENNSFKMSAIGRVPETQCFPKKGHIGGTDLRRAMG